MDASVISCMYVVFQEKSFFIEVATTYEDFSNVILSDKRASSLDSGNIKLTYNSVSSRAGDSLSGVWARDCTESCKWPGGGTVHLQSGPGVALDLVNGLGVGQFTWGRGQGLHSI